MRCSAPSDGSTSRRSAFTPRTMRPRSTITRSAMPGTACARQRGSKLGVFCSHPPVLLGLHTWSSTVRAFAQTRLDDSRGLGNADAFVDEGPTTLALTIDRGLQARDHVKVETAFREVFAILLDDLLISIQRRLA